jgi:hypothetical protein
MSAKAVNPAFWELFLQNTIKHQIFQCQPVNQKLSYIPLSPSPLPSFFHYVSLSYLDWDLLIHSENIKFVQIKQYVERAVRQLSGKGIL